MLIYPKGNGMFHYWAYHKKIKLSTSQKHAASVASWISWCCVARQTKTIFLRHSYLHYAMQHRHHMVVSWNRGTPQSFLLTGFSTINHPAIGVPPLNPQISGKIQKPQLFAVVLGRNQRQKGSLAEMTCPCQDLIPVILYIYIYIPCIPLNRVTYWIYFST